MISTVGCIFVRVAQWIARLPPKQKVAGSNPASDVQVSFCTLVQEFLTIVVDRKGDTKQLYTRPINSVGRVTGS